MKMTTLGRSGLRVSRISLGTWQFGGDWGTFDEGDAIATIRAALDMGVNFFDTAQAYGFGVSERVLGRALEDVLRDRRDDVVIATKGGLRPPENGTLKRDSSPEFLRQGVEQSLEALGIDHIDLYQVHWPDTETDFAVTAEALQGMVDEGLIRHVGTSNYSVPQLKEFAEVRPVETIQPPYHLFRREIEEEVLPYCLAEDIGVLVYGPLAHGLLGGRMTADPVFAEDDWRHHSRDFKGETWRRNFAAAEELKAFAAARDLTLPELAVAWTLAHPAVHVTIIGARRPDQLTHTVAGAAVALSTEDLAEIDRIMADTAPVWGATPEGV